MARIRKNAFVDTIRVSLILERELWLSQFLLNLPAGDLVPGFWYLLLELRDRRLGVVGKAEDLREAEDVEDVLNFGGRGGEDEVAVVLHRGVEGADEAAEAGGGDVAALLEVDDDLVDA